MNNEQPMPQPQARSNTNKRKGLAGAITVIGLLLLAGVGYGGYLYGSQGNQDNNATDTPLPNSAQSSAAPAFHTVLAVGYPYNSNKALTTKLAVPQRLQAVAANSNIQDPGYTTRLANKFNEEMGRWRVGNPELSGADSNAGEVSIIHIGSDWLQETTVDKDISGGNTIYGYDFTTPAKKSAALAQLEADTKECAKNNEKGFTVSDALAICFTPELIRQAGGSYSPTLNLKGYGVIDSQKYVLFGYLRLVDGTHYSESEADKKSAAFAAGTIPDETKKLITEYVSALKNTTITSGIR